MAIKASPKVISQIKKFEGFSSKPYKDLRTGKMAIGFGDTEGDINTPVTPEEAHNRLLTRVKLIENELSTAIRVNDLTQDQQDALVDFHYNAGLKTMMPVIERINSGAPHTEIADALAQYNKSTDAKTGEVFKVPSLAIRAQYRSDLWRSAVNESLPNNGDMLEGFTPKDDNAPQGDMLAGFEPGQTPINPKVQLDQAADAIGEYSSAEVLRVKEAKRLSDTTGIPYEDAYSQLYTSTAQEIIARNAHAVTAEYFPAVTKWAQKDDANYVMMRDTGNYTRKVEATSRPLNKDHRGDWEKAIDNNRVMLKEAMNHLSMALGTKSPDEVKKTILEVDDERAKNSLVGEGAKEIQKVMNANEMSLGDIFAAMAKNPEAALQLGIQSQGSTIATMGAGIFGGLSGALAAGPAGGTVGTAASAYFVSHLLSFSEYMTSQLEPFRDPVTNIIDVDKAMSDPARVRAWQKEADVYGLAMGVSAAAMSLLGGKIGKVVANSIFKAPAASVVGKIAKTTVKIGASSVAKGVEEGASQTAALTGVNLYKGNLTQEEWDKNVKEGKIEAALSLIPGAGMTVVGHAVDSRKQFANVISSKIKKSESAVDSATKVAQMRETVQAEPKFKEDKEQVKDLIDESLTPKSDETGMTPSKPEDITGEDVGDETTEREIQNEKSTVTIEVSPNEWDEMHNEMGLDPIAEINKLSPEVRAAYTKHKGTDTSITIPLSEWVTYDPEELNPKADTIIRVEGKELNAKEGTEQLDVMEKNIDELMTPLIPQDEVPPPLPVDVPSPFDASKDILLGDQGIILPKATEDQYKILNIKSELINKYRHEDEQKIYLDIMSTLKAATSMAEDVDPVSLEVMADIQITHLKHRANLLGVPLKDISSKLKYGTKSSDEFAGAYAPKKFREGIAKIIFNKWTTAPAVVHEFGHSWLHEMAEDFEFINNMAEEVMTPAQLEYKQAMTTASELLGMENMGELITLWNKTLAGNKQAHARFTKIHETFAQTTEKYFLEGKFENSKIKMLMDAFRKWMTPFIDTIGKVYKQFPPLKVTPEVERMFDAILGASEKAEDAVMPMFEAPIFDNKALGEDGKKYMEDVNEALSEAITDTYTNIFNKTIRQRDHLINKAIKDIRAKAEAKVAEKNSMKLLSHFENAYAEYKKGELSSDPRFSLKSIAIMYFQGDMEKAALFKSTLPTEMVAGKGHGGLDISQFMSLNDMSDKVEMMKMLAETSKREDMIDAEMRDIADKEFPIFKTDDEIHKIAIDAMNQGGKEKLLLDELKILANRYLPSFKGLIEKGMNPASFIANASRKVLKIKAERQVLSLNHAQFDPMKILRDSERQGRGASKFFKKGDMVKAFDYKYLQAQNFFAFKFAQGISKKMASTRKLIRDLNAFEATKESAWVHDLDVMTYGKQVIIDILSTGSTLPLSRDNISEYSGVTDSQIELINKKVLELIRTLGTNTKKDTTVEGILELGEVLSTIVRISRASKEVEIGGVKRLAQEIGTAAATELRNGGDKIVDYRGETAASKLRVSKTTTEALMKGMYGSDVAFNNSMYKMLSSDVKNKEAQRNLHFTESELKIGTALAKASSAMSKTEYDKADFKKSTALHVKKLYEPIIKRGVALYSGSWDQPIFSPKLNMKFNSKADLLHALLVALGSESGARKFLLGNAKFQLDLNGQLDESLLNETVEDLINDGTLIKEDFEFMDVVWEEFRKVWPMVRDAMRKVDGFPPGKIEGRSVKNSLGEFKGGYFPVTPSKEYLTPQKIRDRMSVSNETNNINAHNLQPSRKIGNTKTRTDEIYPIDLNLKHTTRYLSTVLNIAYLRVPMSNMEKVLHTPDMIDVMEGLRPGAVMNVIIPSFERTKNQVYTEYSTDFVDNIARHLRHGVNQTMYLANFGSAARQLLGLGQAATMVNPYRLIKASAYSAINPKTTRSYIMERSPIMKERFDRSLINTARSIEHLNTDFDWITWTNDKLGWATYAMSQITQNFTDTIIWRAAYGQAIEKFGMTEEQAINYATDAVETTQSSPSVSSMTNLQSGRDTKKLFTQILSVPTAIANMVSVEAQRDQTAYRRSIAIGNIALFAILLPTIAEVIISGELADDDDEDKTEEEKLEEKMKLMGARALGGGFDTILPMLSRPLTGNVGPVFNTIGKTPRVIKSLENRANGVDMRTKDFTALMNSLTLYTGSGIFTLIGKGNLALDQLKSDEEKRLEIYKRRYKFEEIKYRSNQ